MEKLATAATACCYDGLDMDSPAAVADASFVPQPLIAVHDPLGVAALDLAVASSSSAIGASFEEPQLTPSQSILPLKRTRSPEKVATALTDACHAVSPQLSLSPSAADYLLLDDASEAVEHSTSDPQATFIKMYAPVNYDKRAAPVLAASLESVGQSFTTCSSLMTSFDDHLVPKGSNKATPPPPPLPRPPGSSLYAQLGQVQPLAVAALNAGRTSHADPSLYTFGIDTPAIVITPGVAALRLDGVPVTRGASGASSKGRANKATRRGKSKAPLASSKFCHICLRRGESVGSLACSNLSRNACRKVVCHKCFNDFGWDWAAAVADPSWLCCHCRGECPDRAQCYIYGRVNMRRHHKLRQERAAEKLCERV